MPGEEWLGCWVRRITGVLGIVVGAARLGRLSGRELCRFRLNGGSVRLRTVVGVRINSTRMGDQISGAAHVTVPINEL
jgi:hypothetical protein